MLEMVLLEEVVEDDTRNRIFISEGGNCVLRLNFYRI